MQPLHIFSLKQHRARFACLRGVVFARSQAFFGVVCFLGIYSEGSLSPFFFSCFTLVKFPKCGSFTGAKQTPNKRTDAFVATCASMAHRLRPNSQTAWCTLNLSLREKPLTVNTKPQSPEVHTFIGADSTYCSILPQRFATNLPAYLDFPNFQCSFFLDLVCASHRNLIAPHRNMHYIAGSTCGIMAVIISVIRPQIHALLKHEEPTYNPT